MVAASPRAFPVWLMVAVVWSWQNAQLVPSWTMVAAFVLPCWLMVALSPSAKGWLLLIDGFGTGSCLTVALLPAPFWLMATLPPSTEVCVTAALLPVPVELIAACEGLPLPPYPSCR